MCFSSFDEGGGTNSWEMGIVREGGGGKCCVRYLRQSL